MEINCNIEKRLYLQMDTLLKIGNHFYDKKSEHFSLEYGDSIKDVKELFNLRQFPLLKSASFSGSDLNDDGLSFISNFLDIENLCLQETEITNNGIKYLKKLEKLSILRLKDNPQLTNECVPFLTEIENLQDLQIHGTSITQDGLEKLGVMKNLKNVLIDVWNDNFTYDGLLKLSINMPNCAFHVKSGVEIKNGKL